MMGKFLAYKAKLQGLSKNKIIVTIGVVGLLLALAVLFGVFDGISGTNKLNSATENKIYTNNTSSDSINQILDSVKQKKLYSDPVPQLNINSKQSSQPVNLIKEQSILDVPPIMDNNTVQLKQKELEVKQRYELGQVNTKYNSYTAKSLIYSKVAGANKSNLNLSNNETAKSIVTNNQGQPVVSGGNIGQTGNTKSSINATNAIVSNYLDTELKAARSPYEVKAGSVIPALMINGLNSDLAGQVIAQVRQNVYDSVTRKYLLIPQGARLIGVYDASIAYGQQRVLVAWQRLIYPDGSSINLKAMPGTDLEGYAGFYDQVDNHYWKIFGTSFIMGVITAAMQYSQNNTNANVQSGGIGLTTNQNPTVGQTLSGSLGQQLGQTGLSMTQKNLNIQPTLIIQPNYPFNIMVTADMILQPWHE